MLCCVVVCQGLLFVAMFDVLLGVLFRMFRRDVAWCGVLWCVVVCRGGLWCDVVCCGVL